MPRISRPTPSSARMGKPIRGKKDKRLDAIFFAMERDTRFIANNRSAWRQKYPERWVAVLNERVVGFNKNRTALSYKLCHRGIDPRECEIEFIETRRRSLILHKAA